jgi:hypothetical protein
MVDSWKGQYQDHRKWKPMGGVNFGGKSVALAALKKDQVRIGCVIQPEYKIYMVFGTTKDQDEWDAGEVIQFQNAAHNFLEDLETKKKKEAQNEKKK